MSFLVSTYERKLGVNSHEALVRVVVSLVLVALALATIALAAWFYPKSNWREQNFQLLSGKHVLVNEILDGDVSVDEEEFVRIARNQPTFVAGGNGFITYYVKVDNVGYRYTQTADYDQLRFEITGNRLENGQIVRVLNRDDQSLAFFLGFMPILVLALLFLIFIMVTSKDHGTHYQSNYRSVFDKR